ncbi:hypothetical protein N9R15_03290 [Flavobacteriaceae bacterium]|nr:hypothetical protein [Flavobacteriaceae bacterium]
MGIRRPEDIELIVDKVGFVLPDSILRKEPSSMSIRSDSSFCETFKRFRIYFTRFPNVLAVYIDLGYTSASKNTTNETRHQRACLPDYAAN